MSHEIMLQQMHPKRYTLEDLCDACDDMLERLKKEMPKKEIKEYGIRYFGSQVLNYLLTSDSMEGNNKITDAVEEIVEKILVEKPVLKNLQEIIRQGYIQRKAVEKIIAFLSNFNLSKITVKEYFKAQKNETELSDIKSSDTKSSEEMPFFSEILELQKDKDTEFTADRKALHDVLCQLYEDLKTHTFNVGPRGACDVIVELIAAISNNEFDLNSLNAWRKYQTKKIEEIFKENLNNFDKIAIIDGEIFDIVNKYINNILRCQINSFEMNAIKAAVATFAQIISEGPPPTTRTDTTTLVEVAVPLASAPLPNGDKKRVTTLPAVEISQNYAGLIDNIYGPNHPRFDSSTPSLSLSSSSSSRRKEYEKIPSENLDNTNEDSCWKIYSAQNHH